MRQTKRNIKGLFASVMGTHAELTDASMAIVVEIQAETSVVPSHRVGGVKTPGRAKTVSLELKLPMVSTREGLAKTLESFAKTLRDSKLGDERSPFEGV